jgi:hypothetical protein
MNIGIRKKNAIVSQSHHRCLPNGERIIQLEPNYIRFANYWFVDTQSHENIFQMAPGDRIPGREPSQVGCMGIIPPWMSPAILQAYERPEH